MGTLGSFSEDQRDFYHAYGLALAFWAEVEADLGHHFRRIAGLQENIGDAVYYSARSFLGRADMLAAAIPFARTIPDGRAFLVRSVNLARSWASSRNRLAHDLHFIAVDREAKTPYPILRSPGGAETTVEQIQRAAGNFMLFAEALRVSMGKTRLLREPELCLALLDLLPADALATSADRSRAEPLLARIQACDD